jgi:4-hydroxy-3-polyprenylbenzoate decarboxylase
VVVGLSGASGMPYALDLLQALAPLAEVHLVLSQGAKRVLWEEMGLSPKDLYPLAARVYKDSDLGAPIASGSFQTRGMVVIPAPPPPWPRWPTAWRTPSSPGPPTCTSRKGGP